jgi:hypothetical protein
VFVTLVRVARLMRIAGDGLDADTQRGMALALAGGMRPTLIAIASLIATFAAVSCKSSKCYPDCIPGYEPVPNACTCRPAADAATDGNHSDRADDSTTRDSADGDAGSEVQTVRKRVFHLVNGALGKIRDSSDTRTGLEVADADCTTAGKMYGGGQWRAWLSSSSMNAIDRLADVGPWYRLDQQTKLFESRTAITQGPLVPIEDPADAGVGVRGLFWSGTMLDGTASAANCTDWTEYVGGIKATVGRTDIAGPGWVAPTLQSCSTYLSLLCFEQ